MQVELLVANGAHPSTLDKLGHTPEECTRYVSYMNILLVWYIHTNGYKTSMILHFFKHYKVYTRAYRLQRRRGHVTSNLAKFKSSLKIVEFLNMHSASAVQTANVTIISYKPLPDLNFARYTQHYGSYMPSSPLESIGPWCTCMYCRFQNFHATFVLKIFHNNIHVQ